MNYAIEGIVYALRTQRNMRLHVLAAAVVLAAALLLDVDRVGMIALLFAIGLVLITELTNTAVEAAVDHTTDHFDPMAKTAKDVAAGSVLVASVIAVGVGYLVFFDRLTVVAREGLSFVHQAPPHLTIIALGLTVILVLVLKALTKEGTFLKGGWPSGHTALAVAAATAIGYASNSASLAILALFIAALVAQSRVESDTHTIPQVIFGAVLGFLITTVVFQLFFA
jgi:diacylglycerol kinase (ATP)